MGGLPHIGGRSADKQMDLMGALGPEGMKRISDFAKKWGME